MRTLLTLCLMSLLAAPLWACDKCGAPPDKTPRKTARDRDLDAEYRKTRQQTGKVYEITVPNMVDGGCVGKLAKRLEAIEGVVSIQGDGRDKKIKVTMAEGKELSDDQARKAIEGAGHKFGGKRELQR